MGGLLRKTVRRLSRRPRLTWLTVVCHSLEGTLPAYHAQMPFHFDVLPLDVQEIKARLAHLPVEHRSDIEQRIHNGHRCFVAKHGGQIVFVSWAAFGKCYSYALDREYKLADTEAYGYSAYTLPEFRGNGLHAAATCYKLRSVAESGCKRYLFFVEPRNSAAKRMPEKLGLEKVGITGLIEVFGIRWYFHWDGGAFSALKKRNYWRKV